MTILHRYAIRCPSTGHYLPDPGPRGVSHVEPAPIDRDVGVKLYRTERGARNAIVQWKRGRAVNQQDEFGDPYVEVIPEPHRARRELNAVLVEIHLP